MEFFDWLKSKKAYQDRSARDVLSRLKRVKNLLGSDLIDKDTIKNLEQNDSVKALSAPARAQLRRCVKLYLEFKSK